MDGREESRQRRWGADTVLLVGGVVLAAAHLALFWMLDALPFQDLPNHLTRAVAEVDLLLHGGARFGRQFVLEPVFSPYLAGDALLAGLVAIFGDGVAGRLWLMVIAASFPLALALYLRVTGHERFTILVASVLSLYLTTDNFFLFGMHHYRLAVALVLLALAAWEVWLRRGTPGAYLAWMCILATGYLVHLSALVYTAAAAGVITLVSLWMRQTRWMRPVAGFIPVLGLLAWQAASARGVPAGKATWGWDGASKLMRVLWPYFRYRLRFDAALMVLFTLACLSPLLGGKAWRRDRRAFSACLLAGAFLALYALMPSSRGPITYLDVRAMPLAITFALVAALAAVEWDALRRSVVAGLALCLVAANLVLLSSHLLRSNSVMRDYRALVALLPPGASVLPIQSAPIDYHTRPFHHAGAYATLDAGAYTPYLFAAGVTPYFRYRAPPIRPIDEYWYDEGRAVDDEQRAGIIANYDFLLVGNPYDPGRLSLPVATVARREGATLLKIIR